MKVIKKHMKGIIVLLVVLIGAAVGLTFFFKNRTTDTEAKVVKQNVIPLGKQTLTKSISATGTIESSKTRTVSANLNNMTVKKVKVKVGDTVKKGQELVTFDKTDLKDALEEAKDNLAEAKSEANENISDASEQLSDAKEAYSKAKTQAAKAEAEEKKAKAAQEKAEKEAKAAQEKAEKEAKEAKEKAKKELETAKKKVSSLEKKLAKAKNEQKKMQLEQELAKAKQDLETAQRAYETASASTGTNNGNNANTTNAAATNTSYGSSNSNSVDQAKSSVSSAQKNLKNAKKNAEKSIKEAKKQVEQARENLAKCAVTSPITGIVTAVNIEDGTTYTGGTMFQIEDVSSYKVTTSVDEYDISDVSVGQKAVILTEATDQEEINGKIIFVAPSTSATYSSSGSSGSSMGSAGMSSSSSSSDGYEVVIKITDKNEKLKLGMTAKCSIILEQVTDVFAVPYDAIHKDSDRNDVIYVAKSAEDTENYTEVSVTKGMESDYYVEISGDGLEEGMFILIPTDETESKSQSSDDSGASMMFPGGGSSGFPGGSGGFPGGSGGSGKSSKNGGFPGGPPSN